MKWQFFGTQKLMNEYLLKPWHKKKMSNDHCKNVLYKFLQFNQNCFTNKNFTF